MRFLSFVGGRDNERRKIARCERAADNRLSLTLTNTNTFIIYVDCSIIRVKYVFADLQLIAYYLFAF